MKMSQKQSVFSPTTGEYLQLLWEVCCLLIVDVFPLHCQPSQNVGRPCLSVLNCRTEKRMFFKVAMIKTMICNLSRYMKLFNTGLVILMGVT